jgi:hypothetical protein
MNALLLAIIHRRPQRQEFIRHNGFNEHRVYVVVLVKNIFQRRLEEIPSARVDVVYGLYTNSSL